MINLVLVRHGQSVWNRDRRLTGWSDVPLSDRGRAEARAVGLMLAGDDYQFDVAFTSCLERAEETLSIVLESLGRPDIPIHRSWRLNERHYGAMQGMSRPEAAREFGLKQLLAWQSGYAERPPPVPLTDQRHPRNDPRYAELPHAVLPDTESLRDTLERVLPFWQETVLPEVVSGRRVLLVAHKTSVRALRKHLEGISDEAISRLTVHTGEPIAYRLDAEGRALWHRSLNPSSRLKRWTQAALGKWIQASSRRSYP